MVKSSRNACNNDELIFILKNTGACDIFLSFMQLVAVDFLVTVHWNQE